MTAPCTALANGSRSTRAFGRHRSWTTGLAACLASGLLAVALLLIHPASVAWSVDAGRGKALFGQCKRCHQVGGGAEHRIGPQLNDVFGRAAGSLANYRYSQAMKAAGAGGLVWAEATLDAFLSDPPALVPSSRMSFAGLEGADRQGRAPGMAARLFRSEFRSAAGGAYRDARGIRPRSADPRHPGRPRIRRLSCGANAPPATGRTEPTRASPR